MKVEDSLEDRIKIAYLNSIYQSGVLKANKDNTKYTAKKQDEASVSKCHRNGIIKLNRYIYILMSSKRFFQETLGTNTKECLQAPVALDTSKGFFY